MNKDGSLPKHVTYKIRQNATLTPRTDLVLNPEWIPRHVKVPKLYYLSGFTWIQVNYLN